MWWQFSALKRAKLTELSGFGDDVRAMVFARPRIIAFCVTSLVLSFSGPFGTFTELTLGERLLYWTTIIGVSILMAVIVRVGVARLFAKRSAMQRELLMALLFTLGFTPCIYFWNAALFQPKSQIFMPFYMMAAIIFVITIGVIAMRTSLTARRGEAVAVGEIEKPRLALRLPNNAAASILRLTVEDHYVEIHLEDGTRHRILMRLGDAVSEMDMIDGFCTHRSHWITRASIATMERENGRDFARLRDGTRIPVSRKYRPNLVEAGLLD